MESDLSGQPFWFENYRVGDSYRTLCHTVSATEIIEFAGKWDPQPWHTDEAAASASIFGGLTACSAHVFSIFSLISPKWENGALQQPLASLGFDEMRMIKPVYAGDTLQCTSTVELARPSRSKPDRGVVASRIEMRNLHGDVVFSVLATFLIATRPASQHA